MKIPSEKIATHVPAPDTIVVSGDGTFGPMMFHYATEGCNPTHIAGENGFDIRWIAMEDVEPENAPCALAYQDGETAIAIDLWNPEIPNGWTLSGVVESEEGLAAILLRKRDKEAAPEPERNAA
jgi:hypothetical protein